jgi:hypothetical protein
MVSGGSAPQSTASPKTISEANADINIKPSKYPMSPMNSAVGGRRSFYDRTFSKLEKGSVRGSIFTLCSAALGGGVLSLSYVAVLSGWAMALILLVIGAVASCWSNLILTDLAIKHGLKNYDEICFKAGGDCLRKTLQVFILIYVAGSCIGY